MDEMPSAEFRKRYASLKEPTLVTVNGHVIGTWTPREGVDAHGRPTYFRDLVQPHLSAQAQRDDLLRKINRSR